MAAANIIHIGINTNKAQICISVYFFVIAPPGLAPRSSDPKSEVITLIL